eukprot:1763353-Rhodomonas_salina.1
MSLPSVQVEARGLQRPVNTWNFPTPGPVSECRVPAARARARRAASEVPKVPHLDTGKLNIWYLPGQASEVPK